MVQNVTTGCFGNSCRYSAVQSHWGAVVPPVSGLLSSGTHGAFRGTYMHRMHAFLEESDAASLRRRHRRCARDVATRMSRTSLRDTEDRTPDVSSRPRVFRRSGSRVRRSAKPAVVACSSVAPGIVRPHRSEGSTIRALMDLAIPKFTDFGDRPRQPHQPWIVRTDSPASPAPVCSADLLRSPSLFLNLDELSSDEDKESVGLSDISVAPICGSDDCHTPVNSEQVLSDEDLPAAAGAADRRLSGFGMCLPMCRLWTFLRLVGFGIPDGQCGVQGTRRIFQVVGCSHPLALRPWLRKSGLMIDLRVRMPPVSHWWSEQTIYQIYST